MYRGARYKGRSRTIVFNGGQLHLMELYQDEIYVNQHITGQRTVLMPTKVLI